MIHTKWVTTHHVINGRVHTVLGRLVLAPVGIVSAIGSAAPTPFSLDAFEHM